MGRFETGQLVLGSNNIVYRVEDIAIDGNEKTIYLLKELFPRYKYDYEENLEGFYGTVVNENELRHW